MEILAMEGVEATDEALLNRFAAGDAGAFDALVRRYHGLVFTICRRICGDAHEAEDAAQAVFILLARKARRIAGQRPLAGWLHHASRNIARHWRDARRARRTVELREQTATDGEADERWLAIAPILDDELAALPETYRAALILHHLVGLSQDDAARTLGWKVGTLSGRLSRARELLRARLVRRGVTISLPLLAALLGQRASAAAAPPAMALNAGKALAIAREAARFAYVKLATVALASAMALGGGVAVARARAARHAPAAADLAFDFEDGRRPASLIDGDVTAGPPRAGNRFCVVGVVDATQADGQHRSRVVFRDPGRRLAVYRPGLRLSFDCWTSGFLQVYLHDLDRPHAASRQDTTTFSTSMSLGNVPEDRWTRVTIDLADLRSATGPSTGPAAGDRLDQLEFDAVGDGSVRLAIDNVSISGAGPPAVP